MNIVVCVKQVPDTAEVRIDPATNTLVRQGVPSILNPFDKQALETALLLKDVKGGKVVVLTMGPPQATDILKEAIAMGADEAVLLSDRAFAGADTLATSTITISSLVTGGQGDFFYDANDDGVMQDNEKLTTETSYTGTNAQWSILYHDTFPWLQVASLLQSHQVWIRIWLAALHIVCGYDMRFV